MVHDLFVVSRNYSKNERLPNELITNFLNMADDDNIYYQSARVASYGNTVVRGGKNFLRDAYTLHPKSRYNIIDITLNVFGIFEIHK